MYTSKAGTYVDTYVYMCIHECMYVYKEIWYYMTNMPSNCYIEPQKKYSCAHKAAVTWEFIHTLSITQICIHRNTLIVTKPLCECMGSFY